MRDEYGGEGRMSIVTEVDPKVTQKFMDPRTAINAVRVWMGGMGNVGLERDAWGLLGKPAQRVLKKLYLIEWLPGGAVRLTKRPRVFI